MAYLQATATWTTIYGEKNAELKLANQALNFENSGIKDWKQAHVYGSCEIKESQLVTLN